MKRRTAPREAEIRRGRLGKYRVLRRCCTRPETKEMVQEVESWNWSETVEWVTYHLHIPRKSHLLVATHGSNDSTPWQYSGRINWSRSCWWPSIAAPLRVRWCTPTPRDILDAQQPREKFYKGWSGQLKRQSAALSPPWETLRAPDASPERSGSPVTSSTLDATCLACCPQERGTGV